MIMSSNIIVRLVLFHLMASKEQQSCLRSSIFISNLDGFHFALISERVHPFLKEEREKKIEQNKTEACVGR